MSMAQIQLLQRSSLSVNNQQKAPRPFKSRGFYYCKVIRYIIFIHPIRTGPPTVNIAIYFRKPPHWRSGRAAGEADGVPAGAAKACPAHTKKGAPTSYDVGAPFFVCAGHALAAPAGTPSASPAARPLCQCGGFLRVSPLRLCAVPVRFPNRLIIISWGSTL